MNTVKAEVLGMKMGEKHVIIKINGALGFVAKLLNSHVQRKPADDFVEIWIDFHGNKRFIGYQNPYSVYKLVTLLYSNFMSVVYVENGREIDMVQWIEENTTLDFNKEFETYDMDL